MMIKRVSEILVCGLMIQEKIGELLIDIVQILINFKISMNTEMKRKFKII